MSQRRIYEFDYSEFSSILRRAKTHNKIIEKSNKEAWMTYVRKHNVPEGAMTSRGKSGTMFDKLDYVIIEGAGMSDGYYVYSSSEQFCLKFESGE